MAKKTDKKSYYAIIPADVRYDDNLPAGAKLLYGEITALCNEQGFCWASNNYFAKLYKKSVVTISRWVAQLINQEYISSHIDKEAGNKRQLFLSPKGPLPINKNDYTLLTKTPIPIVKNDKTLSSKMSIPIGKNVKHNNKDNTTLNIKDNKGDFSQGDLSSKKVSDKHHHACTLLRHYGVDVEVARQIVYDQHTPLESIEEVIKNGLAKEAKSRQTDGKFVLEAGYIIKALNQARHEGKTVGPTKLSKALAVEMSQKIKRHKPLSGPELQKRKRRIRAQAEAMEK